MAEIYRTRPQHHTLTTGFEYESGFKTTVQTKLLSNEEPVVPSSVTVDIYTSWLSDEYKNTNTNPLTPAGTNILATEVETDIGVYSVIIPQSFMSNETLRLIWKYVVDGTTYQKETWVEIVTPYVSILEAAEQLGFGSDYSDPNHKTFKELQRAEKFARMTIESYTNQHFNLKPGNYVVYGHDSDTLTLPRRIYNITRIKQGEEIWMDNWGQINNIGYPFLISYGNFGITVDRSSSLTNDVYIANGMVPPSIHTDSANIFRQGKSYTVRGIWGWDHVPSEVEEAAIDLMKFYFAKDRIWKDRYVKSISTTDWDVEYSSQIFSGTGSSYADKLLEGYIVSPMVLI